jgi:long-chain acyl-CoA synthetase
MTSAMRDVLITGLLRRTARLFPDCPATFDGGISLTWLEFEDRVAHLAGGLRQLGLEAGDRVGLLAFNSSAYLEMMFAVPWAGGIIVPLNTRLSQAELTHCISEPECSILICDLEHLGPALAACEGCLTRPRVIVVGNAPADNRIVLVDELIATSRRSSAHNGAANDVMGIFYTGGTTGRAKGAMLTHTNMLANTLNLLPHFRFSSATRCLNVSPMFHIAAAFGMFGPTVAGGQHFFLPKYEPSKVIEFIRDHQISFMGVVPTMVKRLIEAKDFSEKDLSSLKDLFYGGSPTLEPDLRAYSERLPLVRLHQGYGLTETSPTITYLSPECHALDGPLAGKATTVGQPVMLVEVGILSPHGEELPPGAVGEICVRGATVMQGYWGRPVETAEALKGGWFHTGDLGHLDSHGFLTIADRLKDMIISGGENIYSIEVEQALLTHPDVVESAVIGVPSEVWGEAVHAVVRIHPESGLTPEALLAHCRERLSGYKCPKSFELRTNPLPLSSTNKIAKAELRQALLDGASGEKNMKGSKS